ncbi:MAG: PHP domain-containing protein [Acidimicrobiaceae bacterium]|nr:PHP domain-containing protein [Acidimicrobiaceae bacterium]
MEPDPATGSVVLGWRVERPDITSGVAVVDCHTHTYFSGDSSTLISQYVEEFHRSGLTHVFVTDHQSISAYPLLVEQLGRRVICGQEQRVAEGEVIGLFLNEKLPPGMRLRDASRAIREQGGVVYLCHPLDKKRFSVGLDDLMTSVENGWIDAIELCNSKSASLNPKVAEIAAQYNIGLLGGSDSHVASAIGSSGAVMPSFTSAKTFLESMKQAIPYGRHFDPPKSWPLQVVPTTSD